MPDYSKTIIYKIQHEDDENLLYIGSTTNFTKRKYGHKSRCGNCNFKLYQMIRDNGGWDCFKMIQIKEFRCNNRREACLEEDNIMMEMKANMNTRRSNRTIEDYRINSKDKIKEQKKISYYKNKDKILEKCKEKITCDCGCIITKLYLKNHRKSKKHINLVKLIK